MFLEPLFFRGRQALFHQHVQCKIYKEFLQITLRDFIQTWLMSILSATHAGTMTNIEIRQGGSPSFFLMKKYLTEF